ncbi:hypothetical protein ACBR40_46585 [Nonomuraea sp. AD125B]|uniref:hypothetical protein n=1 Tax=Nonomuraea sp. AD125B TaxID=3242897 RepID=UPI003528F015
MLKRSRLVLAMSVAATVLCGCGGAAESPAAAPGTTAPSTTVQDKKRQFEAAKADCMKQKGFTYVPYVKPEKQESDQERKLASGDYEALRTYREKYGFGVFAQHVYPKELNAPEHMGGEPVQDPNIKIASSLSPSQGEAYQEARDACVAVAGKQALGLTLKSSVDYYGQIAKAHKRAKAAELDGDQDLVSLAGSMATCLKGKGYTVSDTKPTAVARRGELTFLDQQSELGRKQQGDQPGPPKMTKDTKQIQMPTLTPEEAKPYLAKEIKAALDDLECGKDFYAAYLPKETAVQRQVNEQFAF